MATYETRAERAGRLMGVYPKGSAISNYSPRTIPRNTIPNPNAKVPSTWASRNLVPGSPKVPFTPRAVRPTGFQNPFSPPNANRATDGPYDPNFVNPFATSPKSGGGAAARVAANRVATGNSAGAAGPASAASGGGDWHTGMGRRDTAPNAAMGDKAAAVSFFRGLAEPGPEIKVAPLQPGSVEDSFSSDTMGTVLNKLGTSIFARVRADANYKAAQEAKKAALEKNNLELTRLRQQVTAGTPDEKGYTPEQRFKLRENRVHWPGMKGVEGPLGQEGDYEKSALSAMAQIAARRISAKNNVAGKALNYSAADSEEKSLLSSMERQADDYSARTRGYFEELIPKVNSTDKATRENAMTLLGVSEKILKDLPSDTDRLQYMQAAVGGLVAKHRKRIMMQLHNRYAPSFEKIRQVKSTVAGTATGDSEEDGDFLNAFEKTLQEASGD